MMKLLNQLLMVARAQPLALIEEGKTSDGIAQGIGPHVAPKVSMKNNKNATLVHAAA